MTAQPLIAHLGKGQLRPRCIPRPGLSARGPDQTRFAFWTADRGDFISPWTLDRRETSLSPWTPIDQACAAMDLHQPFVLRQQFTPEVPRFTVIKGQESGLPALTQNPLEPFRHPRSLRPLLRALAGEPSCTRS